MKTDWNKLREKFYVEYTKHETSNDLFEWVKRELESEPSQPVGEVNGAEDVLNELVEYRAQYNRDDVIKAMRKYHNQFTHAPLTDEQLGEMFDENILKVTDPYDSSQLITINAINKEIFIRLVREIQQPKK